MVAYFSTLTRKIRCIFVAFSFVIGRVHSMNSIVWGILAAFVVVAVVAGVMVYQTTTPDIVPTPSVDAPQFLSPSRAVLLPTAAFNPFGPTPSPTPTTSPLSTSSPVSSPVSTATAAVTTIAITDTGFSPATVTIAAGSRVNFVNNGQGLHWPASDPHPVHSDLPGFDSKKGLTTGEIYSFTFTTPGSWGFHDHLNPAAKGTVVVQ
jgi:plastocyanin